MPILISRTGGIYSPLSLCAPTFITSVKCLFWWNVHCKSKLNVQSKSLTIEFLTFFSFFLVLQQKKFLFSVFFFYFLFLAMLLQFTLLFQNFLLVFQCKQVLLMLKIKGKNERVSNWCPNINDTLIDPSLIKLIVIKNNTAWTLQ